MLCNDRFFRYCPSCGFDTYENRDTAISEAEECIDHFRDSADDKWSDDVTLICWGEIKGEAVQVSSRPYDPDTDCVDADPGDEICEFEIRPIEEGA